MNNENKAILDKKDLNKVIMRWMPMAVNTYNYQYQQAGTVVYSLYPALRKIYKNDEELQASIPVSYTHLDVYKRQI